MNRKLKWITAGLLSAALLMMSGCSTKAGNPVVAYGGKTFYENEMYYNIYYNMGMNYSSVIEFDETDEMTEIRKKLDELAQKDEQYAKLIKMQKIIYVKQKVADAKALELAKEANISLSDEDNQTIKEQMDKQKEFFDSKDSITQVKESLYKDDADGDQKAKQYLIAYKKFLFGMYNASNFNGIQKVMEEQTVISKLLEQKSQEIPDDEAYIKNYYDELAAEQKTSFDSSAAMLEYEIQQGRPICYYPAGLRRVKHILVGFTDEEVSKLDEYQSKIDELNGKENRSEEENAQLEQARKDYDSYKAEMDARVKQKADEAYGKLQAGTAYDEVLKGYGEDASMKEESSSYQAGGYLVSKDSNYVKEFLDVALSLKNPGDYSQPVLSDYGYHIIQYASEVKNETVPYETIRDEIVTVAMEEKRQNEMVKYYGGLYDQVIKDGGAQIHYDVLGIEEQEYQSLYQELMKTDTNDTDSEAE